MLRTVSSVTVALGLVGATVTVTGAALAAPGSIPAKAAPPLVAAPPAAVVGPPVAVAGKKRCSVTDPRLRELSGLVATKGGYVVINDSTDRNDRKRVFYLNKDCQVVREVSYSGAGPLDTEDLAVAPDGKTLWIADTGDNVTSRERRERVAVWSMPIGGGSQPKLHRLSYPDGKPRDAEALLIGDDKLPLIITKVTAGKAEIFTPDGPLKTGDTEPVPMKKLGDIELPKTDTENPLSTFGRVAITGAARSLDGARVVVRTYADAFEYDVSDGDVVAALTTGTPRVTALADPFGEAIAYSTDGKTFLTVSDAGHLEDDDPVNILSYTPSREGPKDLAQDPDAEQKSGQSFLDGLTPTDIMYLIAAVGVLGALLVGAGIFGILRARKRPAPAGRSHDGGAAKRKGDGFGSTQDRGRGGAAAGGVYGGSSAGERPGGGARPGGVYGGGGGRPATGNGARPGQGGGVYGGGGGRPGGEGAPVYGGRPGGGRASGGGGRPGGGVYGGGGARGGGQSGGGGRAEPPRRGGSAEPDYRGRRSGRYRDDDNGPYGQVRGGNYGYRGDRY